MQLAFWIRIVCRSFERIDAVEEKISKIDDESYWHEKLPENCIFIESCLRSVRDCCFSFLIICFVKEPIIHEISRGTLMTFRCHKIMIINYSTTLLRILE